jgi:hypothetical protein
LAYRSIHAGLRPVEWAQESARIYGGRPWLNVVDAKATNGRANGASRTLDISDFSEETFGAVDHAPFDGCRSSENGFLI